MRMPFLQLIKLQVELLEILMIGVQYFIVIQGTKISGKIKGYQNGQKMKLKILILLKI
jgi:hypothetical protein